MSLRLKIASRASPLAKIQVQEILSLLPIKSFDYELITCSTKGDVDKATSLTLNPGDDFFTNTLDEALLKKEVDVTVHSAKDLPEKLNEDLKIFALTKPLDDTDSWVSPYPIDQLPQGAKIGTSSVLRGQMITALREDLVLVDIRGTIHERLELLQQKKIDGLIVATCALKRLGLEKHIRSILPWEAMPLQGQLAVVGRKEDWQFERLFESIDIRKSYGQVFLVGAGPGDPQLITLKAIEILKRADCVFYDYLLDSTLLKYAFTAEHIYVGKRKGEHTVKQDQLCQQLKNKALQGKKVVRLKGGDPLIFGRGADEISYLRSYHIPVQVVPGVSSATGIPSFLGVPLTARGISSSVAFLSGYAEAEDNQTNKDLVIPEVDTVVFLMGLSRLGQIVQSLIKAGWSKTKPIMVISNGTKADQKIVCSTLDKVEKDVFLNALKAPALIVVGQTVNFYKKETQKILLHCGTHPEEYIHLGHIISWPMIQIQSVEWTEKAKQELILDFNQSDFVILTSPNAVEHFIRVILGLKSASIVRQKIYTVIGRATAEVLEDFGMAAQIISSQETAEGLFHLIAKVMDLQGKTILLPRSNLPNPFLRKALEQKGAIVKEWTIYKNTKIPKRALPKNPLDGVIFTSPSTFHNFLKDYGTISASWQLYAKGSVTAKAMQEAGYQAHVVNI